ncbi:EAL domain-containing protein [Bacillus solitudinis]|uniref:EAL domain-containing protein n=1 Tax=Bacillus solitudinis TaxID=2014074 RepID=UPI000C234E97|nr:EAL domain-containing protein [Bacillus solitudinis]
MVTAEWVEENAINGLKNLYCEELMEIINHKQIESFYQPIVCLKTALIHGYEGLSRTNKESYFSNPLQLFTFAEKSGQLYTLEKVTRELVIERSTPWVLENQKLFININSHVIYDPEFTPGYTSQLLKKFKLKPSDIVFEITERSAIQDFKAFKEVLTHYRKQGYKVAIDDAGAGYSSLQAITEIEPDYIKIDRSLISDIDKISSKEAIVQAFITFAKQVNSKIIAEGIESKEELSVLIGLGVDYAQGFFLGRPHFPGKGVEYQAKQAITKLNPKEGIGGTLKVFFDQTTRKDIEDYFNLYPQAERVAMIERGRLIGLIKKRRLFQSNIPLYGKVLAKGFREEVLQKIG